MLTQQLQALRFKSLATPDSAATIESSDFTDRVLGGPGMSAVRTFVLQTNFPFSPFLIVISRFSISAVDIFMRAMASSLTGWRVCRRQCITTRT